MPLLVNFGWTTMADALWVIECTYISITYKGILGLQQCLLQDRMSQDLRYRGGSRVAV